MAGGGSVFWSRSSVSDRLVWLLSRGVCLIVLSIATGCSDDQTPSSSHHAARELTAEEYDVERGKMVERLRARVDDERVLAALRKVPRHEFVLAECRGRSYEDVPLPIDRGQTMYSPHLVARLTQLLEINADERVLEVGTGSGYQTAVMAELSKDVYTIEIVPELKNFAEKRLTRLRSTGQLSSSASIRFVVGDGSKGLSEAAPFDAILVSAASKKVPGELEDQLAPGGRMLIPVGSLVQKLLLIVRSADGSDLRREEVDLVRWDELVGESG